MSRIFNDSATTLREESLPPLFCLVLLVCQKPDNKRTLHRKLEARRMRLRATAKKYTEMG